MSLSSVVPVEGKKSCEKVVGGGQIALFRRTVVSSKRKVAQHSSFAVMSAQSSLAAPSILRESFAKIEATLSLLLQDAREEPGEQEDR